jgi:hypothetical protein
MAPGAIAWFVEAVRPGGIGDGVAIRARDVLLASPAAIEETARRMPRDINLVYLIRHHEAQLVGGIPDYPRASREPVAKPETADQMVERLWSQAVKQVLPAAGSPLPQQVSVPESQPFRK